MALSWLADRIAARIAKRVNQHVAVTVNAAQIRAAIIDEIRRNGEAQR